MEWFFDAWICMHEISNQNRWSSYDTVNLFFLQKMLYGKIMMKTDELFQSKTKKQTNKKNLLAIVKLDVH